jgi:hypothetical protein
LLTGDSLPGIQSLFIETLCGLQVSTKRQRRRSLSLFVIFCFLLSVGLKDVMQDCWVPVQAK